MDSLVPQTLAWFNPDPGKIFDDQYSYSSVWYRIIFLVLLCRHPRSSNCVRFGVRFSSTGCSLWFPSVWDIQFTVVLIYPSDLHSLTQEKSKCWFIHCLRPQMDLHLDMWITACLWLLLAVTKRREKKKKITPNISFVTPRFRNDIPFYFPLHTWALWSIWSLCATV